MKDLIKMCMSLGMLILFVVLIGNKGNWIIAGLLLFGISFGWYANKCIEKSKMKPSDNVNCANLRGKR